MKLNQTRVVGIARWMTHVRRAVQYVLTRVAAAVALKLAWLVASEASKWLKAAPNVMQASVSTCAAYRASTRSRALDL